MAIIEREVEFAPGVTAELYHAVGQQDYIAIVAMTPDGKIPIVRQYRPALERFTWELPAGLVDEGEAAAETCKRELMEETGFPAKAVHALGDYAPCTARLSNQLHSFFVETGPRAAAAQTEIGIELKTGDACGTGRADPGRRIRSAAAYRRPAACRHARPYRSRRVPGPRPLTPRHDPVNAALWNAAISPRQTPWNPSKKGVKRGANEE